MTARGYWETVGGLTADHFGFVVKGWQGPFNPTAFSRDGMHFTKIKAEFSKASGERKAVTVSFLKRTTKITVARLPHPAREGEAR